MRVTTCHLVAALLLLIPEAVFGDDVLFEDGFNRSLSRKWQVVGLNNEDYRIRDGGLEMRVQRGKFDRNTPMLKLILPFNSSDSVIASVKVTVLDAFTQDHEFAGIYLLDETGAEFGAKKERVAGKLVFAPGNYRFKGQPGDEGDPANYTVDYTPATKEAGALRIIVNQGYAYFQVGPSTDGKHLNFFHSAIRKDSRHRGFGLVAAGAPDGAAHWVRFEGLRITRQSVDHANFDADVVARQYR